MCTSAASLAPEALRAPGAGVDVELLRRVASTDYESWLGHVSSAAGCTHPIKLRGKQFEVEESTGRIVRELDTTELPDGVLYVPCGNRRAAVCPPCAEVYRADTFQLIRAGLVGGKGVPDTIVEHPSVFLTLTAPSFGPVHTRRVSRTTGKALLCRPRRNDPVCEHGVPLSCNEIHDEGDSRIGHPVCTRCYDYAAHVVWNIFAPELWRRTRNAGEKAIRRYHPELRLSYAKVAEYQHRGVVHFHALVRLDGIDPSDPEAVVAPVEGVTAAHLEQALRHAVEVTEYVSPTHPKRREGWSLVWGEQVDVRHTTLKPSDVDDAGEIEPEAVAGYLAKYATKSTEATGHVSARITPSNIEIYSDPSTHTGRIIATCWELGKRPRSCDTAEARKEWKEGYGRLRRWAHSLGFGGHYSTKTRRYSTTLGALRQVRREWRRQQRPELPAMRPPALDEDLAGEETVLVINELVFAGVGWHTSADAMLANTAAAQARERRLIAREELSTANHWID